MYANQGNFGGMAYDMSQNMGAGNYGYQTVALPMQMGQAMGGGYGVFPAQQNQPQQWAPVAMKQAEQHNLDMQQFHTLLLRPHQRSRPCKVI